MRIVAFNGSPRRNGNTFQTLNHMLERLAARGCETELVQMGAEAHGCIGCGLCRKNQQERCFQKSDPRYNEWFGKMLEADGVILGSPVYAGWLTPLMKGFVEKAAFMARGPIKRGGKYTVLRNKVGVAVAPTRRSGGIQTLQSMIALFAQSQMIMPCGGAWPITSLGSMDTDAFSNDPEGVKIVDRLADNMMDVLEKLHRAR